ncbi:unnamed protein product, partial [Amoebophrya sp. A120]
TSSDPSSSDAVVDNFFQELASCRSNSLTETTHCTDSSGISASTWVSNFINCGSGSGGTRNASLITTEGIVDPMNPPPVLQDPESNSSGSFIEDLLKTASIGEGSGSPSPGRNDLFNNDR